MTDMGFAIIGEGVKIKNVPSHEALKACSELGNAVAAAMKK